MREHMKEQIPIPSIRYFSGSIDPKRRLSDIDLAMIDDAGKVCIVFELKWFIAPAEVREVIERSEEIEKGISQLMGLSGALEQNPRSFCDVLGIDESYEFLFAVVSDSFIGMRSVQNPKIPVVRLGHLVRKANSLGSLRKLYNWLRGREYLPVEGKDYEIREQTCHVGRWGMKWYGILPLVEEYLR